MLSLHTNGFRLGDGGTRRDFLRVGAIAALGLSLPGLLAARRAQAGGVTRRGRAKSCILFYLSGGPPQDIAATVFHCLGVPSDAVIHDPLGRPVPVTYGDVIRQAI